MILLLYRKAAIQFEPCLGEVWRPVSQEERKRHGLQPDYPEEEKLQKSQHLLQVDRLLQHRWTRWVSVEAGCWTISNSKHSTGTNFPPELYDGHLFGRESYYEELAKAQKEDMERRETLDRKTAEARKKTGGDNRLRDSSSNNPLHRKSKWDQQGPGVRTK